MKRKSMATLIGGLLSVCLIGVGFASWIIVQGDSEEVQGNVRVEEVIDRSVFVDAKLATDDDGYFNFTSPKSSKDTDPGFADSDWLRSNTDNKAKMDVVLDVTVTNPKNEKDAKVSVDVELDAKFAGIEKYVTLVDTADIDLTGQTADTYETQLTVSFAWGEYFGKQNPYAFYNSKKAGDKVKDTAGFTSAHASVEGHNPDAWTWAQEATYVLNMLEDTLAGAVVTVTLTVESVGA